MTEVPVEWTFSIPASGRLDYQFNWLYGIQITAELARRLLHEPRLIEIAERYGYVHRKEL
ncbi:hypothetical protein CF70_034930 [Cupriavidus sp. SK-3]|uniref:hypothetical protein n=1 Tax=Cupriavidus sp. SK-3 TaxID=1470558 RepID=UPI0004462866|nr:hypothetical protein [Cupriavidus sp. SK-3]KDP87708.1 hypothetical protein CF70_034930 [Cupriavidus sp. SK-3]